MTGGGYKPMEGTEVMGASLTDSRAGGTDFREPLKGGGPGNYHIWRGDLGRVPQDCGDPW